MTTHTPERTMGNGLILVALAAPSVAHFAARSIVHQSSQSSGLDMTGLLLLLVASAASAVILGLLISNSVTRRMAKTRSQ